jgi:hypothetical protein
VGQKWPPENVVKWTPLSAVEFQRWLGLSYLMGIIKLPAMEDYWTYLFGMPSFGSYMSRDRFSQIKSMLQLESPTEEAGAAVHDRAPKVRLWLRTLESNCEKHTVFMPKREVAIDEQSITFTSLWAAFTHQNRHKPSGQGFSIYSITEVETEYTSHSRMTENNWAQHPRRGDPAGEAADGAGPPQNLRGQPLYIAALGHGMCGTWRANYYIPAALTRSSPAVVSALKEEGAMIRRAADAGMIGWVWHESKICNFLCNFSDPTDLGHALLRERGVRGRPRRQAPRCAADYNIYMMVVDKCDQKGGRTRRSSKWWMPLFYWTLDIAAVNGYAIHQHEWAAANPGKRLPRRDRFRWQVALVE